MPISNRISAVLCSTDLVRSQEFYEQKDGLALSPETIPNHTQVRFWSTDVEHDVGELAARGVVFEDYDFPALKTVNHIATTAGIGKSAWFKDPDGNTLALFQPE